MPINVFIQISGMLCVFTDHHHHHHAMEYFQEATPAADGSAFDLDIPPSDDEQQEHEEQQKEPLTEAQERRLRDYLDEEFTQIQRHLTKRSVALFSVSM